MESLIKLFLRKPLYIEQVILPNILRNLLFKTMLFLLKKKTLWNINGVPTRRHKIVFFLSFFLFFFLRELFTFGFFFLTIVSRFCWSEGLGCISSYTGGRRAFCICKCSELSSSLFYVYNKLYLGSITGK